MKSILSTNVWNIDHNLQVANNVDNHLTDNELGSVNQIGCRILWHYDLNLFFAKIIDEQDCGMKIGHRWGDS